MRNDQQNSLSLKIPAIKSGIHDAFIEVYHEMHVKVFRFFLKRVLLHDTAKDLTQQCFIRLWQFRHTLSEEHPLEKQVFIIARSLLINHLKQASTQKRLQSIHSRSLLTETGQTGESTHFELSNAVNAAIATLPPIRKRVIILKAFHGCSNKEIAQQMKISVKTVEDHITKAFRHIRQVGA
jgi:RNA polymerase sigma-70 factor (ECF subfamily)